MPQRGNTKQALDQDRPTPGSKCAAALLLAAGVGLPLGSWPESETEPDVWLILRCLCGGRLEPCRVILLPVHSNNTADISR